MNQTNPFLGIKTRTIFTWFLVSIFIYILLLFFIRFIGALIPGLNNWEINSLDLEDPLFQLIILNVWIYSVIVAWSYSQVQRTNLSLPKIIGKLPKNRQWLLLICLTIPVLMFSLGYGLILFYLLTLIAPSIVESTTEQHIFLSAAETAFPYIYNLLQIFFIVILAPITEEILFRGLILQRWSVKWGTSKGIIFSSLFFGMLHPNPIGISMFGVIMSLLYIRQRTLILPIICHMVNNGIVVVLELLTLLETEKTVWSIEQVQASWWQGIVFVVLAAPWLIWFLRKNWPNQQQLLPYFANFNRRLRRPSVER